MKALLIIVIFILAGCKSLNSHQISVQDQLQLSELIDNVAKRQNVELGTELSPYLFTAPFSLETGSILGLPGLLPALIAANTDVLIISLAVVPGDERLQLISHGVKLTAQLQEFLQTQQFVVQRRFDAESKITRISIADAARLGD